MSVLLRYLISGELKHTYFHIKFGDLEVFVF